MDVHKWIKLVIFGILSCKFGITSGDDITSGPVFLTEPRNRIDFSNTTGTVIECAATGNPQPEIIWVLQDGTKVSDVPGLRQVQSSGSLVFPPFRAEDYRQEVHAQTYRCKGTNAVGTIVSRDVQVRAVVSQDYDVDVNKEYVIRGNSAIVKCLYPSFVAEFLVVDSWISETETEFREVYLASTNHDSKYLVLPSGELHIRDVTPEDGFKTFRCRTKHRLTGETKLSATAGRLVITEPVGSTLPKIAGDVESSTVKKYKGTAFAVICPGQASPPPVYRWYKFIDGQVGGKLPVKLDDRVKQVSGTLIIRDAKVGDSGKYLCVVNNSVGGESVETILTVTAPLSASVEPASQTAEYGRPAVFTCNPEGNPIKSLSWYKDGKALPGANESVLKIESVKKDDKGMYQCFVRNDHESAQFTAELKLGGKFDPPQLLSTFPERTIQPGPTVSLKCSASGNPLPEITWEIDGKRITNTDRYQINQLTPSASEVVSFLNISSITTNDGGLYVCKASSKVGVSEHSARQNVYGMPFVKSMEKMSIVAGETMYINCPYAGHPIDSISWERGGRILPINKRQQIYPNGTLVVEGVQRNADQGSYTCVVKSSPGYSAKGTVEVQVMVPPKLSSFDFGDDQIFAGSVAQTTCVVTEGESPIEFQWSFTGSSVSNKMGISVIKAGPRASLLIIDPVSPGHSGEYACTARNRAGTTSHTALLHVHVPPRWIIEPTDKAFAQGSEAKIECKADGFPKPTLSWKRATGSTPGDYRDIKTNSGTVRVEDGTLTMSNIQKSSEGYYLCEASNGIGAGLSAVIYVSVQAPPHFEIKFRNQTARRNEPVVLQCEAKGEKPIGILWNMNNKRLEPKSDNRYTIREEILQSGVMSDLSIRKLDRSDSALYTCVATNAFGSDDTSINLIVQEVPETPSGLKVLDKSGRVVQLQWTAPYDGNAPITRYLIEYKLIKGDWNNDIERVLVPGSATVAGVYNLRPSTNYHFRLIAENEVGASEPSSTVTIVTAEEVPSGPPRGVKVEALDQSTLKVMWKPPSREHWNGDILGYYVGYKLGSSDKPFLFETVEFNRDHSKEHSLQINNLKTYTEYSVVVQAFNKVGAGPMSEEVIQFTGEGTPDQPPQDFTCATLTSTTIGVSWSSPPLANANGVIKGYKVIYAPAKLWFDEASKDTKITSQSETVLHGLKKYTNYSITILAYTGGGDGVKATPMHCYTEQDVPDAPQSVKALQMSPESILISWLSPEYPNGIITQYTVYVQEAEREEIRSHRVPSFQLSFEASGLKEDRYNFWVTASTVIGEGEQSKQVSISPSSRVPAKIASFDDKFTVNFKDDIKLPCQAVGIPVPELQWRIKGSAFVPSDRHRLLPDGSLLIREVSRDDAGEYSCSVENPYGQDTISHILTVHAPPSPPAVSLTSSTTSSISIKLKPKKEETAPIYSYIVHYKPEFGEWEQIQIANSQLEYTVEGLQCGQKYQLYASAQNTIGTGEGSEIIHTRTKGSGPTKPEASKFLEPSSNSVTLHLGTFSDGGCPMLYFVVEYKIRSSSDWTLVTNSLKPGGNFVVLDLAPGSWYNLKVTAHNNAGFAVAEYEFATLTVTGATIAPMIEKTNILSAIFPHIPEWLQDLNLLVPTIATLVVILVGMVVVCVALSRRGRDSSGQSRLRDDMVYSQSVNHSTLGKQNQLRDELGYIPPPNRKLPPVPGNNYNTVDRIKRGTLRSHATWNPRQKHMYEELALEKGTLRTLPDGSHLYARAGDFAGMEDEIAPYATFHLLGFREEMDPGLPSGQMQGMNPQQFQTMPHSSGMNGGQMDSNFIHQRNASQSMPRQQAHLAVAPQRPADFGPQYDDPANCEDPGYQYAQTQSQYGGQSVTYDQPSDAYGTRSNPSMRRSVGGPAAGTGRMILPPYPEPPAPPTRGISQQQPTNNYVNSSMYSSNQFPPPPPSTADLSTSSNNDSGITEGSEPDNDRDQLINRGGLMKPGSRDALTTEEMRKLIEKNEASNHVGNGLTAMYDTVNV
ncbi:cell adhesion molecule Dscam1-like isoform X11 [Artemia franciscana]|uniref:cell adhesion molecule Dscam1-like isoform X11 n=1 Tax=Artemia franciscana TaxID=6661 RepID=UPI0032DBA999